MGDKPLPVGGNPLLAVPLYKMDLRRSLPSNALTGGGDGRENLMKFFLTSAPAPWPRDYLFLY